MPRLGSIAQLMEEVTFQDVETPLERLCRLTGYKNEFKNTVAKDKINRGESASSYLISLYRVK